MKRTLAAVAAALFSLPAFAQQELPLYPSGQIPFNLPATAKTHAKSVVDASGMESKIGVPSLTYYAPAGKPNGGAVMICPGGSYKMVSTKGEGSEVAHMLNGLGYAAFVLHYRLPDSALVENRNRQWVPLGDAIQGMHIIKENAQGLGIDTSRIGVIGFSAGGHLAATLATIPNKHPFGSGGDRPAWTALIYPVTTMYGGNAQVRKNLLGGNGRIRPETDSLFSPVLQVTAATPPAFIVHSQDDKTVPFNNSVRYAEALGTYGGKADLHLYATGDHGYGVHGTGPAAAWPREFENWLKGR